MDDVKITDAISSLSRNAGLNYMLDPKIGFGQVDPATGKPVPEPIVSIRWENVTAEQALYALLNNYDLQVVEDPKSHIARITKRDPTAPPPLMTQIFQLKYASPTNLIPAVTNTFADPRRSRAVADIRTSQIVVRATEEEIIAVDRLLERLDTITKQVLIETRILETSLSPSTSKGIDWTGTLLNHQITVGNGHTVGTTTTPGTPVTSTIGGRTTTSTPDSTTMLTTLLGNGGLSIDTARGVWPPTFFLNSEGVSATLSFLNKQADAKVISAPRTVTLDNETAKIEVTRASPIINITPGTVQTAGGSQITYTNLGVILNVTPRISANNFVNLKVIPEVSRIFDTVTKIVPAVSSGTSGSTTAEFQADEYDIRKMETRVMIPSGNTLVLGGLVQDDVRNNNTKVPLLGDIPYLGYAFRSENKTRQKSNLLIFITPTIVQDSDYQPTGTDFLKTPVVESVEGEWGAWDTANPYDWSKPAK
jgi:general secretion pathway protein D